MSGDVVAHHTYNFSDGNAGHVIDLGSALSSGQADVLLVNSDTTVSTPSGFSGPAPTFVGGQGWYVFRRQDSGGQTVTITTATNNDTCVIHVRLGNIVAADQANSSVATTSGASAPALNTGTLAENHEIVVVHGALHNFPGSVPTSPVWGGGATAVDAVSGTTVVGFAGVITDTGTDSSENPTLSWTNAAVDRYIGILTYTTSASSTLSADAAQSATATQAGAATLQLGAAAAVTATATQAAAGEVDRQANAAQTATATQAADATASRQGAAAQALSATQTAAMTLSLAASASQSVAATGHTAATVGATNTPGKLTASLAGSRLSAITTGPGLRATTEGG